MTRRLQTYPDLDSASSAAAAVIARALDAGRAGSSPPPSMALSGGSTPIRLYELFGTTWRDRLPWAHVHLFWADERFVPGDHPENNFRMAAELFVDRIPVPPEHVHPIPTDRPDAESAAAAYEAALRTFFEEPASAAFDTALLGLGEDGHTASLFPLSPPPAGRWVAAVRGPDSRPPVERITLTPEILNRTRIVVFLVSGPSKKRALERVMDDDRRLPASHIRGLEETIILADAEAAGELAGRDWNT